ncbi:MAG: pro-sigmaK processing inhibitor BofA family protein [Natronincolaceae bacterium]|jgi:inhibitor of the pro-sigma K processing machinery|nr:pro-sigmaK processing inhibitor BofA family protein [Bacillota bacterium]NLK91071.1 pro-sigmaK processing inhibitor BofA [Clostridiales bacterium]
MGLELNIILAYAVGLILLYVVGWILLIPLRWMIRLIWNGTLGGIMLFIINLIGGIWGIHLAINPFSAVFVGVLGIPGVILLLLLKYVL